MGNTNIAEFLGDIWADVLLWNNFLLTALTISSILATVDAERDSVRALRGISLFLTWITALSLGLIVSVGRTPVDLVRPAGAAAVFGAATVIATLLLDRLR